ncbi:alpha/beta hydrolase [Rhodoferax sp.]|uniref:alpha/beta hydrolase n=1 Tax=Rhodoferax sp. TaxID=50421 RepID=UPI0027772142|nr:acyl-CoA thioester hydrolase/BAAT C-terminal domain-containing protein [Rhodoferax sp.]
MSANPLGRAGTGARQESVRIGRQALPGTLELPEHPLGIVVFANELAASHASTRNARWAKVWRSFGLGALLLDLLTEPEAQDRRSVLGVPLLGARLADALDWLERRHELLGVPIGLFGVGTGAAVALLVAARQAESVGAVVCSDGRTDFVSAYLPRVRAPTLLLVSSQAEATLGPINRAALSVLTCNKRLETLPRAVSGDLDDSDLPDITVSLAGHWFERHLNRLQH